MNFIVDQYGGQAHWAKIELPLRVSSSADGMFDAKSYEEEIGAMRNRILKKFPVTIFNEYRNVLDPENVLSNQLIDELISK